MKFTQVVSDAQITYTTDQKSCIHHMKRIQEPPYRYVCLKCGKKLKIANGVHIREAK